MKRAAVAQQEARPHGNVGVLEAAPTNPDTPLAGSLMRAAASTISAKFFGYAMPLASNSSLL